MNHMHLTQTQYKSLCRGLCSSTHHNSCNYKTTKETWCYAWAHNTIVQQKLQWIPARLNSIHPICRQQTGRAWPSNSFHWRTKSHVQIVKPSTPHSSLLWSTPKSTHIYKHTGYQMGFSLNPSPADSDWHQQLNLLGKIKAEMTAHWDNDFPAHLIKPNSPIWYCNDDGKYPPQHTS